MNPSTSPPVTSMMTATRTWPSPTISPQDISVYLNDRCQSSQRIHGRRLLPRRHPHLPWQALTTWIMDNLDDLVIGYERCCQSRWRASSSSVQPTSLCVALGFGEQADDLATSGVPDRGRSCNEDEKEKDIPFTGGTKSDGKVVGRQRQRRVGALQAGPTIVHRRVSRRRRPAGHRRAQRC